MLTVALGVAFVAATVALTLGCYLAMRYVTGGDPDQQTKDLAGSVIFRISALHGLILALVFAQEMVEYQQLKYESAIETNALADVYFDALRYGGETAGEIMLPVYNYVEMVLTAEWQSLGDTGELSGPAWGHWDAAYVAALDLVPETPRQESLRQHLLERLHVIAETRVKRANHAAGGIDQMFWFAAIAGVVLIALAYYSYPPRRHNLILISMFGAFTGIILFFIYAFANPYSPPGALGDTPYARLLEQFDRSRLQQAEAASPAS